MTPKVSCALERASSFLPAGSSPRRTSARMSRAVFRALPGSSSFVEPRVIRRFLLPIRYCTIHTRAPLSRRRTPKPGTSSSKKIASFLPGGSGRAATVAARLSFIANPPWEADGKQHRASSCSPVPPLFRGSTLISWAFQASCFLVHSPAEGEPHSGGQGVPSSNLGAPTKQNQRLG